MAFPGTRYRRLAAVGISVLALVALAVVLDPRPREVSAQQPFCSVDFGLPAGSYAELQPGQTATFSYSASVTAFEMREIVVDVITGPSSGFLVDVQPASTSVTGIQPGIAQTYPVFGRISVTVPEGFEAGTYSVSGIGAIATCSTVNRDGSVTTQVARSSAVHLTIDVVRPLPTATPEPEPTSTSVPPPAVCDPGLTFAGLAFDAAPGERISVPFEASVAVRRLSGVTLELVSGHQGGIAVTFEPAGQTFGFDPLPSETVLRTFSGTVHLDIPDGQQSGSYDVGPLTLQATCRGVDAAGSPTSFTASSSSSSITIRLAAPTATPEPTSTSTPVPSPTATSAATATPRAARPPSATPTSTPRSTARATSTVTATATPDDQPVRTATRNPTDTPEPTSTPRSVVPTPIPSSTQPAPASATPSPSATVEEPPVGAPAQPSDTPTDGSGQAGSTMLSWEESRALFAEEESETGWGKPLAVILAAVMIALGGAGVWHTRLRA